MNKGYGKWLFIGPCVVGELLLAWGVGIGEIEPNRGLFFGCLILLPAIIVAWIAQGDTGLTSQEQIFEEVPDWRTIEGMVAGLDKKGNLNLDFPRKDAAFTVVQYTDGSIAVQRIDRRTRKPKEPSTMFNAVGWGTSPQKASAHFIIDTVSLLPDKEGK